MGDDINAGRHDRTDGPDGHVFFYFCVLSTYSPSSSPFSSFELSLFPWRTPIGGVGQDVTDASGNSNMRRDGGETGTSSVIFFFFLSLFSSLLLLTLLLFRFPFFREVQQHAGRGKHIGFSDTIRPVPWRWLANGFCSFGIFSMIGTV